VYQVAVTPSGARAFVSCAFCDSSAWELPGIVVVDISRRTVAERIELPDYYWELLIVQDGDYLFAGSECGIYVMRTSDGAIVDSIMCGGSGFTMPPDGRRVYRGGDMVRVIDVETRAVVDSLPIGPYGWSGPAVLPAEDYLYFFGSEYVLVFSLSERAVVDTLPSLVPCPHLLIASPDGRRVYGTFSCMMGSGVAVYGIAQDGQ
jgi:DNA-binding beta-propeller fold protein YncE